MRGPSMGECLLSQRDSMISQALRAAGVWTFRVYLAEVAAVSKASRFTLFSLGQTEKVCILRTPRRSERDDLSGQRDSPSRRRGNTREPKIIAVSSFE